MRRLRVLVASCLIVVASAATARADVTVTIVPQTPMVAPHDQSYEQGRTDQQEVTFLVEGSWTTLDCWWDGTRTSCGTPAAPCPVAQCVTFTRTGLPKGNDSLGVEATDPAGDETDSNYRFYVDPKPPFVFTDGIAGTPTRPRFGIGYNEGDQYADVSWQCSFTHAAAASAWASCPQADDFTVTVPARRIDYVFRQRVIDDFGRSSNVVTVPYNPIPCTLGRLPSLRPLPFEVKGVPYDLRCAPGTANVSLDLYLLGENGHNHSIAWARQRNHYQDFGQSQFTRRLTRHGRQRLEPDDTLDIELKQDRSALFALVVTPEVGPYGGSLNAIPAIRYFTLHR